MPSPAPPPQPWPKNHPSPAAFESFALKEAVADSVDEALVDDLVDLSELKTVEEFLDEYESSPLARLWARTHPPASATIPLRSGAPSTHPPPLSDEEDGSDDVCAKQEAEMQSYAKGQRQQNAVKLEGLVSKAPPHELEFIAAFTGER